MRHNSCTKYVVLCAVAVGLLYYGILGVKCINHFQQLMEGRVSTINFNIK